MASDEDDTGTEDSEGGFRGHPIPTSIQEVPSREDTEHNY